MSLDKFKLAVLDMAGTTVIDQDEVLLCFREACHQEGLMVPDNRLNALMGVSKLEVFKILWKEQEGTDSFNLEARADHSFLVFKDILEAYYHSHPVAPTEGALETFAWLREQGIKIALNTGFYRGVTDIILQKLGWDAGLDSNHVGGPGSIIDFSISSDEVPQGRPAPYMIQRAMLTFGIIDPRQVIKIGDTPVDIQEGRNAGCRLTLVVTNGTHSREELEVLQPDGLLNTLGALPAYLSHLGDA